MLQRPVVIGMTYGGFNAAMGGLKVLWEVSLITLGDIGTFSVDHS
jgi:hypothetical protein